MITCLSRSAIKRTVAIGTLVVVVDIFFGAPAGAQVSQAWTRCANGELSTDLQISACTTVI